MLIRHQIRESGITIGESGTTTALVELARYDTCIVQKLKQSSELAMQNRRHERACTAMRPNMMIGGKPLRHHQRHGYVLTNRRSSEVEGRSDADTDTTTADNSLESTPSLQQQQHWRNHWQRPARLNSPQYILINHFIGRRRPNFLQINDITEQNNNATN